MAGSNRFNPGGDSPEQYFDEEILDSVGVVGIWSVGDSKRKDCGGRAKHKAAYGIYFGPDCPHNLSDTIMRPGGVSYVSATLAEICAITVALQVILTSIIAEAELTKDIEVIILKNLSAELNEQSRIKTWRRPDGRIRKWWKRKFQNTNRKPAAFGTQWLLIHNLWLAVEDRGIEIQLLVSDNYDKESHTLVHNARLGQNSPIYHFPLLPAEALSMFDIPFRATSPEKGKDMEIEMEDEDVEFEDENMTDDLDDFETGGLGDVGEFEKKSDRDDDDKKHDDNSMGYLETSAVDFNIQEVTSETFWMTRLRAKRRRMRKRWSKGVTEEEANKGRVDGKDTAGENKGMDKQVQILGWINESWA